MPASSRVNRSAAGGCKRSHRSDSTFASRGDFSSIHTDSGKFRSVCGIFPSGASTAQCGFRELEEHPVSFWVLRKWTEGRVIRIPLNSVTPVKAGRRAQRSSVVNRAALTKKARPFCPRIAGRSSIPHRGALIPPPVLGVDSAHEDATPLGRIDSEHRTESIGIRISRNPGLCRRRCQCFLRCQHQPVHDGNVFRGRAAQVRWCKP